MRKIIDFLKKSPLITAVVGVTVLVATTKVLSANGDLVKMTALRILLFLSACVFVYLVSREKVFENCHTTTGYVVKWGLLMVLLNLVLVPINFIYGGAIVKDWPYKVILSVITCLLVGLFEETTFRVLVSDAIIYKFRNSKYVFVWNAIISCLVFGGVHVLGTPISTAEAALTATLKTLQTAILGFCFLILYWKTRNLWGIALSHCIYDSISVIPKALFNDTKGIGSADSYVNAGEGGIGVYIAMIVFNSIVALILWLKVGRKIDFEDIRKNW